MSWMVSQGHRKYRKRNAEELALEISHIDFSVNLITNCYYELSHRHLIHISVVHKKAYLKQYVQFALLPISHTLFHHFKCYELRSQLKD